MRVLLTADPEIPVPPAGYGGIERIVDALVCHFRAEGHTVGLVAHGGSQSPTDALFPWRNRCSRGAWGALGNALALRCAVQAFNPEVLHSFSRLGYLLPVMRSTLPKIMSYQRHTGGAQIRWAARLAGGTLCFTGCSEFICRMGRPCGGEWHAVPNFVRADRISFTAHVPPDAPLLFLSRVESIKGPHLAIEIAKRSKRRLVIAGNRAQGGAERQYWDREIAPHLGRDGIEYVGEVDDTKKNGLLGRAAALVVPVQWDEPFGIVFAEALAAGTPIITCARGALQEIVRPGITGFFVRSVEDGVEAVGRLSTIDRAACRRDAEHRFSVGVCAAQYLRLYSEILSAATERSARRGAAG